jgi:hypothetical protein
VDAIRDVQRAARGIKAQLAFLGRPEGDVPQVDLIGSAGVETADRSAEARRCVEHQHIVTVRLQLAA